MGRHYDLGLTCFVFRALEQITIALAAPIGAAGRPNRGPPMKISRTVPPAGRRVPTGLRRARGDAMACPGGPNINCAPIRDSRATRRVTTCSELRWQAHIFFWAKTDMPQEIDLLFGFIVTRQTAMPIQIVPRFCARGYGRFEKLLYRCQNPS